MYGGKDIVKVLVGNKVDKEGEREITTAEGAEWARSHGMGFLEASAKMGINVDESFHEAVRRILESPTLSMKSSVHARDSGVVRSLGSPGIAPPVKEASGGTGCGCA